ncbi:hypothetical protein BC350_20245 (plasmid) [Ralstonia pseudosolanacearum]|nr:hypothetical protein BC350_20245 [Ralstonia pseudosolanacearum]
MNLIRIINGFLRGVLKLDLLLVWLDDVQFDRPTSESFTARVDFVANDHNIGSTADHSEFKAAALIEGNIDSHIIPGYHIGRVDHLEQPFGIAMLVPINFRADAQRLIHIEQLRLTRQVVPRLWVVLDVAVVIEAIHNLLRWPRDIVQRLLADRVAEADRCGSTVGRRKAAAGQ